MLGLENVGSYMQAKQAQKLADWSSVFLDNEGKLVQEEMTRKFQVRSNYIFHGISILIIARCSHCVVPRPCCQCPQTS